MTKSTITDERITSVIERLEHFASNLKWTDVRGAQDLLTAADGLRELQERRKAAMDSEPVAWTDEEELRDVNVAGIGYLFGIDREANKFADPRRQIMLYRHAQPAPELKPVGYLFVSDQGAVAYSPTDWGMSGFRLAGQIFGETDTCRAAMLAAAPQPQMHNKIFLKLFRDGFR